MRKDASKDSSFAKELSLAVEEHISSNSHHPEYHGNIHNMEELDIVELVCDWGSRSTEFKTGLQEYIDGDAMKRFGFTKSDKIYEKIMRFKNLLCDQPFKSLKKE